MNLFAPLKWSGTNIGHNHRPHWLPHEMHALQRKCTMFGSIEVFCLTLRFICKTIYENSR